MIRLLANAPAILAAGRANLDDMRGPFVDVALGQLAEVPESLRGMAAGLAPHADAGQRKRPVAVLDKAIAAFADYAAFLKSKRAGLSEQTAVGRESYRYFLGNVGIYPYSPEQLVAMGRQEWARLVPGRLGVDGPLQRGHPAHRARPPPGGPGHGLDRTVPQHPLAGADLPLVLRHP